MPPFSAAPRGTQRAHSVQLQDFLGKSRSARHIITSDTTGAQITALETTIGNLSNAREMASTVASESFQINPANPLNTTYDEAHATVDTVLVMVYQDDGGNKQFVEIGAPDASLFASDGETPDATNANIIAYKAAAIAAMNEGGGTWAFARGFRSTRSAQAKRARTTHPLVEPGVGALPPIAPGA